MHHVCCQLSLFGSQIDTVSTECVEYADFQKKRKKTKRVDFTRLLNFFFNELQTAVLTLWSPGIMRIYSYRLSFTFDEIELLSNTMLLISQRSSKAEVTNSRKCK